MIQLTQSATLFIVAVVIIVIIGSTVSVANTLRELGNNKTAALALAVGSVISSVIVYGVFK